MCILTSFTVVATLSAVHQVYINQIHCGNLTVCCLSMSILTSFTLIATLSAVQQVYINQFLFLAPLSAVQHVYINQFHCGSHTVCCSTCVY